MSIKKSNFFERVQMSAGKMPPWNWADTLTVSLALFVVLFVLVSFVFVFLLT
jgi:hypothetical protein